MADSELFAMIVVLTGTAVTALAAFGLVRWALRRHGWLWLLTVVAWGAAFYCFWAAASDRPLAISRGQWALLGLTSLLIAGGLARHARRRPQILR